MLGSLPRRVQLVTIAAAVLVAGCNNWSESDPNLAAGPGIDLQPCHLSAPGLPERLAARCGTLAVAEDPANPSGRTIDLDVAVVPAVSRSAEPDPLFILAGGPGQAATEVYPLIAPVFERINESRDVVLVDQRGTGDSNGLTCVVPEADDQWGADAESARRWARSCLAQLEGDPRLYTTPIAMDDLDAVRAALGYETVNLYGGSYGTRAALEYVRRHPKSVRTVILDAVLPPDLALGTTVARDAQRALDLLIARCEDDPDCRSAFPELGDALDTLLSELDDAPVHVSLRDPVTGDDTSVELRRDMVAESLRFLSYAPETAALIPLLIHAAANEDDYAPLAAQYLRISDENANLLSLGMHFSVLCAEDVPFFDTRDVALHNADTFLADSMSDSMSAVCEVWPRADVPPEIKEPVATDHPVLVLSGEADPVTPPEYGASVVGHLPNGLHLVGPGQGHGLIGRGCVSRIASEFVERGGIDEMDTDCVDDLEPPGFFLSFSGPAPAHDPDSDDDSGTDR